MDKGRGRSGLREAGQVKERVMEGGRGGGEVEEPVRETAITTTSVSCSSALNKAGRVKKRKRRELVNHCLPWRRKVTVRKGGREEVRGGRGRGAKHQAPQVLSPLFEISHLCLSPFQSLQTAARCRQRAERYCDTARESGGGGGGT